MPIGKIPVVDDVSLSDEMMQRYNLILVGPASANAVLQRLMRELPVREQGDSLAFGDERYRFSGRGYALFHYNPEAPQRYIGVLSTLDVGPLERQLTAAPIRDQAACGFRLMEIAPVARELRRVEWDDRWRPRVEPGDEEPIPERLATRAGWETALSKAARVATDSEFWLGYRPTDRQGFVWDHTVTRWGDLRVELHRPMEFYRGSMTGAELLDLARAVEDSLANGWIVPAVVAEQVQLGATYRVCMPYWMGAELARRLQRNIPDVELMRTREMWQHFRRQQRPEQ